ncbi:hypothetical protein [Acetobacter cerevisiae]|uniref:Uncharacterized protein n=1 Tax=Acetobacter cerevisiae TaxID=178900 RepID=A0A149QVX7_9PROT|nr:hypothetical protein [Acetobacter cerevisiae]KXV01469.1 hypothetical protein AD928_01545 [Acetobacter cerevisiae]GBQ10473.1 hypothetical protein AA14362_2560 [Acetobacter cerevisiae DSM 14362]
MTPTNWPNPERPGYPMFPERDGKHVIDVDPEAPKNELVYYWKAKQQIWVEYDHEGPDDALEGYDLIGWSYIGPVLTPTQINEMLAGERERCAKVCEDEYEKSGRDFEYLGCLSCSETIRNLGAAP